MKRITPYRKNSACSILLFLGMVICANAEPGKVWGDRLAKIDVAAGVTLTFFSDTNSTSSKTISLFLDPSTESINIREPEASRKWLIPEFYGLITINSFCNANPKTTDGYW